VLADGTYATETVYTSTAAAARLEQVRAAAKPPLRALILGGDFFTGSVVAATLTKLVLRYAENTSDATAVNTLRAEAILMMTSIVRVGQSKFVAVPIDEDSQERIMNCVETLAQLQGSKIMNEIFLTDTKAAYAKMVATEQVGRYPDAGYTLTGVQKKASAKKELENKVAIVQPDDLISFRQLSKKSAQGDTDDVSISTKSLLKADPEQYEYDVIRATGAAEVKDDFVSKLSRIVQLTGEPDEQGWVEQLLTL
jgi:coatomer subunit beta